MPRRTATPELGGFGGFGDTPNEYYRFPGGRALVSDVAQARDAMMFGGDGGLPRAPIPTPPPRAQTGGDNSNAGLVNRNLFRHDNRANTDFWEQPRNSQNRPHEAMDFGDTRTSVAAATPSPTYSHTPGAERASLEPSFLFGDPQVETPTFAGSRGSSGNLDTEPSLFESAGTNPFDQWWRTDPVFGDADVSASASANTGGNIWAGDDTLGNFGGNNLALGNDLSADLSSLGYGEGYPEFESPFVESPFAPIAEGTGIPIEPDTLPQDVGDTEWTSTPDDRRFLPGSDPDATPPPTPTRSLAGGPNLRTFGNPISLGAFLNAPLSSLRYGEGYPNTIESGGEIRVGATSPNTTTGRMQRWNGQDWEDAGPIQNDGTGTTYIPLDNPNVATGNDGTGTTFIPIQSSTPPGMTIVGYDEQNGQPVYRDSNGNLFVNPGTGTPVAQTYYNYGTGQREALRETGSFSDSGNQGAEQQAMSPVKFGMNPAGDAGHGVFNTGSGFTARLHPEGGFEMVSSGRDWRTPAEKRQGRAWSDLLTSAQGRAWAQTPAGRAFRDSIARSAQSSPGPAHGGTGG